MAEVALFSHLKNNLESQRSGAEPGKALFTHVFLYDPRTFVITFHVLIEIWHLKSLAFIIVSVLKERFDDHLFRTIPQMSQNGLNDDPGYEWFVYLPFSVPHCLMLHSDHFRCLQTLPLLGKLLLVTTPSVLGQEHRLVGESTCFLEISANVWFCH